MKKVVALFLSAVLSLSLASCTGGGGPAAAESDPPPAAESTSPAEKTQRPSVSAAPKPLSQSGAIEETVLVDEKDVKITATALEYTGYSVELSLVIENNSGEDLSFRSSTLAYACNSINGFMTDEGYLFSNVPAGKKANETVRFSASELAILGISDIADIELGFSISGEDFEPYLQTGPVSLKTSIADTYSYPADSYQDAINSGVLASAYDCRTDYFGTDELYSGSGVRVLSEAVVTSKDGEKALLLEMENTSSQPLYVSAGDFSVNGLLIQSGTWSTDSINPGKRRVAMYDLSSMLEPAYWELFGLSELSGLAFSLTVKDGSLAELQAAQEVVLTVSEGGTFQKDGQALFGENGIRVVSKGITAEEDGGDVHVLLLAENSGTGAVSAGVEYGSLSVNGYMTDFSCYGKRIPSGKSAVLDVELDEYSLEASGIGGAADIQEVEMTLELRDDRYNPIAEPVVTVLAEK